MQEVRLHLNRS